jgi:hypothetical protein
MKKKKGGRSYGHHLDLLLQKSVLIFKSLLEGEGRGVKVWPKVEEGKDAPAVAGESAGALGMP